MDMNTLTGYDPVIICKMVQEREPSLRDIPPEDVEIDLDKLQNSTLQDLKKICGISSQ